MLSLLVARWPGSRRASLCFVAWLEFGTPWHLACCPGRQPGHRLFFEVRSIGKQMVGWKLREYRLCLGDFCQLWLFWQQMIFGWFWPILSATFATDLSHDGSAAWSHEFGSRLATLAPRWFHLLVGGHFFSICQFLDYIHWNFAVMLPTRGERTRPPRIAWNIMEHRYRIDLCMENS